MALNFPPNPTEGQTHFDDSNGVTYTFKNGGWVASGGTQDDLDLRYVEVAGDVMTGNLQLPGGGGNTAALQKQEIDALIVAGDAAGDHWDQSGGALSPKVSTDNVNIGDGKLMLRSNGAALFGDTGAPSGGDRWGTTLSFRGDDTAKTKAGSISIFSQTNADKNESAFKIIDGTTEKFTINHDGSAELAGGNIHFDETGYGSFYRSVSAGGYGVLLVQSDIGGTKTTHFQVASDGRVLIGPNPAAPAIGLYEGGESLFAGEMKIGITGSFTPSTPAISLNAADGSINAAGGISAANNNFEVFSNGATQFRTSTDSVTSITQASISGVVLSFINLNDENGKQACQVRPDKIMLGGVIPSAPNISLNAADGTSKFEGQMTLSDKVYLNLGGNGGVYSVLPASASPDLPLFNGNYGGVTQFNVYADGRILASSDIQIKSLTSTPRSLYFSNTYNATDKRTVKTGAVDVGSGALSYQITRALQSAINIDPDGLTFTPALQVSDAGNVLIGPNLPSAPNITLEAGGTARAVRFYAEDATGNVAFRVANKDTGYPTLAMTGSGNIIMGNQSDISTSVFNVKLENSGNAIFKGTVQTAGGVVTPSMVLQLEAEDDTKYTATTNEDGEETLVYNGATLDMKEVGLALVALKSAAAAATDFTTLKSAIATALANL